MMIYLVYTVPNRLKQLQLTIIETPLMHIQLHSLSFHRVVFNPSSSQLHEPSKTDTKHAMANLVPDYWDVYWS